MPDPTAADSGLDINAAAADIGADLFGAERDAPTPDDVPELDVETAPEQQEQETAAASEQEQPAPVEQPKREMPKSWSKDKQAMWDGLPPEAQDYYTQREKQFLDGLEQYKSDAGYAKQLREVLNPYRPFLQAQGVTETQAVQYLMNAHYRLTQGSEAERRAAYEQIGRDLGFLEQQAAAQADPHVQQLQEKVNRLESTLTARQQAELHAARQKATSEVEVFASDPANAYFNEVANDMARIVAGNPEITLKDAYDQAVWANPVTRAKKLAELQTATTEKKKAAETERAQTVARATAPNVRGVDARKAPTEPKGKFLDDRSLLADLREITSRT